MSSRQRLANVFPLWTKARMDPSSLVQRHYSVYGDLFDHLRVEAVKIREEFRLLKSGITQGYLFSVVLDDALDLSLSRGGLAIPTHPTTVVATLADASTVVLTRDEYLEDLLYGAPTRLALSDTVSYTTMVVWDSTAPTVYNTIDRPNKLTIEVDGSTEFYVKKSTRNKEVSGRSFVQIIGIDVNDISITETYPVRDDGIYQSQHIFKEVTEVQYEGFDGTVRVLAALVDVDHKRDPFRSLATPDLEGPLLLRSSDDATRSYLEGLTTIHQFGYEYRDGTGVEENEESVLTHVLLDSSDANYVLVDFAVSPNNTKLYTVDDAGLLHVYDYSYGVFETPVYSPTRDSYISLIPMQSFVKYGEAEYLWTWFRQPKSNILTVQIIQSAPDGTVKYLQADKSWDAASYSFTGKAATLPEHSWSDFRFSNTYNQVGQWDYKCVVTTKLGDTTVSTVSVLCPSLVSLVDIDTEVVDPLHLFFDHDGKLCVADATDIYVFTEHRDTYFTDIDQSRLLMRDEHTSVEVTF